MIKGNIIKVENHIAKDIYSYTFIQLLVYIGATVDESVKKKNDSVRSVCYYAINS